MFVLRYCVSVSVGILMALANELSLTAQTVSFPQETQDRANSPSPASLLMSNPQPSQEAISREPRVAEIQKMEEPSPQPKREKVTPSSTVNSVPQQTSPTPPKPLSQASPQNTPPTKPAVLENLPPNNLNPSGNPLLFPTKPDEVKSNIRQPVTLTQTIDLALRNNKELQESRMRLEELQAQQKVQQADLFPSIDIEASAVRFRDDRVFGGGTDALGTILENTTTAETFTDLRAGATLTYDIYTGGERGARIEVAARQVRNQELEVERIAEQIRFEATDNYYLLQNADAQVAIAQAAVEDASQTLRDAQLLERAGLGTRFDVLRGESDLAAANQDLTRSISDQRTARRRLAETLSVGQQVELTAADEIQEAGSWRLSLDETIVRAYKNRAELEQQLVQREIGEQNREIALSQIRPQVDFTANYDARENLDDGVPVLTDWTFQIRGSWRIFDGGRAFAGAREAERQMDQANTRFANQRNEIRFQVEEAYYSLVANQENIGSTRQNVATTEEALRLARLRFQAGVGTQTDVINAQRDLTDARGRFLQAIIQYNQSLNSLQRSVSNLPDNRLFEAP